MSYLFGDSTPSPFQINFIEFLRLAVGFSAHVLRVESQVRQERTRRIALEQNCEADRRRLEELVARLSGALQDKNIPPESRVAHCIQNIQDKVQQVVDAEVMGLEVTLTQGLAEIEQKIKYERKSSLDALEKVVLQYDLPQSENTIHVRLSEGMRYQAWLESETPYGIDTVVELVAAPESGFLPDARVDRFMEGLELHAPETAGWLRKESRMTAHKLGRYFVVELDVGETESMIKLRTAPDPHGSGYDIAIRSKEPRIQLTKTSKELGPDSFDPEESDIADILRFRDKLAAAARSLVANRRALTAAQVAGQSVPEYEGMRGMVEQFVQVMAPFVREISVHSLSPGELVLRRLLGDDRREEIFVSKSELRAKIVELSEDDRRLFEPLELEEQAGAAASGTSRRHQDTPEQIILTDDNIQARA